MNKRVASFVVIGALFIAGLIFLTWSGEIVDYGRYYEKQGSSMAPTILDGETIKVYDVEPAGIKRGDIVLFEFVAADTNPLIKRVIGLPGDTVIIEDGLMSVFRGDERIYSPYGSDKVVPSDAEFEVGEDELFVSGDNLAPGASLDSKNDMGMVSFDDIRGIVER